MRRRVAGHDATAPTITSSVGIAIDYVSRCVSRIDGANEDSRIASTPIHLSSLLSPDWCMRKAVLSKKYDLRVRNFAGSRMRLIWALGRAAEEHVRKSFIAGHGRENVVGAWRCACGNLTVRGKGTARLLDLQPCETCGTHPVIYGELSVTNRDASIIGNPDLLFTEQGDDALHVTEIKSMNKESFVNLTSPIGTHELQVGGYVWLLRQNGYEVRSARVLYVCKDALAPKQPLFKEFVIDHESRVRLFHDVIGPVVEQGFPALAGIKGARMPDRLAVCSSIHSKKAKACEACSLCFNLP